MFNRICYLASRGVVSIWSMFVFLTMLTLYLDGRLTGFAKATKTCPAHKLYWRPLNWKRSLAVLKWTSESEYFLSFEKKIADTIEQPFAAHARRGVISKLEALYYLLVELPARQQDLI